MPREILHDDGTSKYLSQDWRHCRALRFVGCCGCALRSRHPVPATLWDPGGEKPAGTWPTRTLSRRMPVSKAAEGGPGRRAVVLQIRPVHWGVADQAQTVIATASRCQIRLFGDALPSGMPGVQGNAHGHVPGPSPGKVPITYRTSTTVQKTTPHHPSPAGFKGVC